MYKTRFILSLVLIILGITSDAHAKKGFYLGMGVPYNTIEGDFNGNSDLQKGDEVIIVPEIDPSFGFGVLFGYGLNRKWAIELNFVGSTHDGQWAVFTGDVYSFSFSINGKYNFSCARATQPYLMFGISDNTLIIRDGSEILSTGEVGDAILSGPGLNLGGGIEHYFKNLSIRFGLTYRLVTYTNAQGAREEQDSIDDPIDGSGFSLMLSTIYHF